MGLRDRFFTPVTARAILSWRIAVGVGVAVAAVFAGLQPAASIAGGLVVYVGLVAAAMPSGRARPRIDPFGIGEPWRQYVHGAQRAVRQLHQTVDGTPNGSVRDRLQAIVAKLDEGLDETWQIARRGDDIDRVVRRLDPPRLRSKLATLEEQATERPTDELTAAIESVQDQLESTERLKEKSAKAANTLRLTQTRLDELTVRAAEVSIGAGDTDAYEHDVEDLVDELEALRLALDETR